MQNDIATLKKLTILIVEDDKIVLDELKKTASIFFKKVHTAQNGHEAYGIFEFETIDLLLTDIKMPLFDGVGLIRKIREKDYRLPIVVLSSYSEKETLLQIVNLGVDGYLVKPVELQSLIGVLLKALRRCEDEAAQIVSFKNNKIFNVSTKELFSNGKVTGLGIKELSLLELLIRNKNKALSKEDIVAALWPFEEVTDSALKGVLNRLRKKIGEEYIVNIKGYGWKFSIE